MIPPKHRRQYSILTELRRSPVTPLTELPHNPVTVLIAPHRNPVIRQIELRHSLASTKEIPRKARGRSPALCQPCVNRARMFSFARSRPDVATRSEGRQNARRDSGEAAGAFGMNAADLRTTGNFTPV